MWKSLDVIIYYLSMGYDMTRGRFINFFMSNSRYIKKKEGNRKSMWVKLRRYFLSGLVIFLPLALTIYLFVLTLNLADGLLGKFIEPYFFRKFGFYFRGLSIVISIFTIFLIGFLATNFLGRKIYLVFERILLKLPFFRQVYPAIKEISIFLFSKERATFKQVVLVEYPRKGLYSVGFFTNDAADKMSEKVGQELCNIFMPSSPGPLTGYILLVPKKDLIFLDVSVEDALKLIVSGGVVNPNYYNNGN